MHAMRSQPDSGNDDQDPNRLPACRGEDPELFFPIGHEEQPAYLKQVAKAKAVCRRCPIQAECLDAALGLTGGKPQRFGVWGGTSEEDRTRELRRIRRRVAERYA